jgi:hypothetical protein
MSLRGSQATASARAAACGSRRRVGGIRGAVVSIVTVSLAVTFAAAPSYGGVAYPPGLGDTADSDTYDPPVRDRRNPVPAALAGIVALVVISQALHAETRPQDSQSAPEGRDPRLVEDLLKSGPQLAPAFNMSAFAVRGLVRGGWPLVVDFEQRLPGEVKLRVSARGAPEIYTYRLGRDQVGRRRIQLPLPAELGESPTPALIAVMATDPQDGSTLPAFEVYGLGAGPRAVGSVAIDQVLFQPPRIRVTRNETAAYRFFSHSDFNHASVEFMRTDNSPDGTRYFLVNSEALRDGVRRDQWIGEQERRDWRGLDGQNQVSSGPHKLQVRVWDHAGDWVTAWSHSSVTVAD